MSCSGNVDHISQPCIYGHFISERKSWFMRWLSKLFKAGAGNHEPIGGTHHPQQFIGDENMVLQAPVRSLDNGARTNKEKEELDRAIALSLAEGLKKPNGDGWRPNNEEDLAKAVQDDLYSSFPSYGPKEYQPIVYRECGGCNRDIGYGNYLGCMGTFFHPQCFCCRACRFPITEQEFSLSGKDAYHKTCFKELIHPKCEVCFQFIPTSGAGLIEYRCHPFWSQKYCPVHEHDNTARCCSCERLEVSFHCFCNLSLSNFRTDRELVINQSDYAYFGSVFLTARLLVGWVNQVNRTGCSDQISIF